MSPDGIEISKRANALPDRKGFYRAFSPAIMPDYIINDLLNHDAVVMTAEMTLLYSYNLDNKRLGWPNTQYTNVGAYPIVWAKWIVPKYTPWVREVDKTIGQIRDMGFFERIKFSTVPLEGRHKWKPAVYSEGDDTALELAHLTTPIIILLTMYFISICFFLLEIFRISAACFLPRKKLDMDEDLVIELPDNSFKKYEAQYSTNVQM